MPPSNYSPSDAATGSAVPARYTVEPMAGVEIYRIGREAIITLQPATGYVSVSCPWHDELNGCHWWTARGTESLHKFLVGLDRSYTLGKLFDLHRLKEYDEEATKSDLREQIVRWRRDGEISKDDARDLWEQVEEADGPEDIARMRGISDSYEFIRTRMKPCASWFWDDVWAAFVAHLQANLPNASAVTVAASDSQT